MENIVMKKLLITTALAASLTTVSVQASPNIAQDDMNQIFSTGSTGNSFPVGSGKQSHQVSMLSNQEMKETEGAWGPWGGAIGAGLGAWGYTAYGLSSGSWSWSAFGLATTSGAAAGAIAGPLGWGETLATAGAYGTLGTAWGVGDAAGWQW